MLRPGMPAPSLNVPLVSGGHFDLGQAAIDTFLLIDVYRGLHCPRCHRHVLDLNSKAAHLARRGVSTLAVSMDPADRAQQAKECWGIDNVPIAYGLQVQDVDRWDLFLSKSINERERSEYFAEPATFLISPDKRLYSAVYNSTPFNRFGFADMLEAIDTIVVRSYPPRGDVDPTRLPA
ncbi:MAG: redoxin domain-containing protein [Rhizobiaceae bacterium]|nr:redoxin domain-containing protein [Rhizobiaceae bacterium]